MNIREIMGMKIQVINMLACINGIICVGGFFVDGFQGFVLWNPATKESKVVSYPSSDCQAMCAFGYDHNSNDYKVVWFVYHSVHVYKLSTESWTQLVNTAIHVSKIISINRFEAIYLNGVHHWVGFMNNGDINELGGDWDPQVIVCFDMNHEVFRVIRFPDDVFQRLRYLELVDVSTMEKTLAVLNDCLAFIVYNDESTLTEKFFDIWVIREYGVEDSWTKQLVVGPLLGIKEPLGFARNGELLLRGGDEAIVLYNIDSQEMKNLQCGGFPSTAMIYVESLVSFPSGNLS